MQMQKKRIVVPLLFLLPIGFAQLNAQTQPPSMQEDHLSHWYVGITGGAPFGTSTFSSFSADKTRVGYNVGVLTGYRIREEKAALV